LYDVGFKLKSTGAWVWCILSVIWSRRPIIVQIAIANEDSLDSLRVFLRPRFLESCKVESGHKHTLNSWSTIVQSVKKNDPLEMAVA
jgi:hypothetical protein